MENETEIMQALERQGKVKVTVEVPVGLAEFIEHLAGVPFIQVPSVKGFIEQAVYMQFNSLLDSLPFTMFNLADIYRYYGARELQTSRTKNSESNIAPQLPQ